MLHISTHELGIYGKRIRRETIETWLSENEARALAEAAHKAAESAAHMTEKAKSKGFFAVAVHQFKRIRQNGLGVEKERPFRYKTSLKFSTQSI